MTRMDESIQPGPTARDDPHSLRLEERNAFYESLPPQAKERFLESLTRSQELGLDEEGSWREAVVAVETAYPPEVRDEDPLTE